MAPKQPVLPEEFVARARAVTAKRAKTVINHILEHGYITTEELKDDYGYNHPPRAARGVREQGIPLETYTETGKDGRHMAAYRFDLSAIVDGNKLGALTSPQIAHNRRGANCQYEQSHGARLEFSNLTHRSPCCGKCTFQKEALTSELIL